LTLVNVKLLLHLQIVLTFFYFVKLKEWVKEGAHGLQTATIDHRRPTIAAIAFFIGVLPYLFSLKL
jgi:hypothetical protein